MSFNNFLGYFFHLCDFPCSSVTINISCTIELDTIKVVRYLITFSIKFSQTLRPIFLKKKFPAEKMCSHGKNSSESGSDVIILKIFSPKNFAKNWRFLPQNKAKLFKILIITLVLEKNANFFAENCQKSQKIVIINSTPDVMIFEIFSPKNFAKNWRFLLQNKAKLFNISIITLVLEKNAIFCRKLAKIAENCDHNFDPWSPCL
jgi:hypothetical protein